MKTFHLEHKSGRIIQRATLEVHDGRAHILVLFFSAKDPKKPLSRIELFQPRHSIHAEDEIIASTQKCMANDFFVRMAGAELAHILSSL